MENISTPAWPVRMRRPLTSKYLNDVHGVVQKPQTLARKAVEGTGPAFSLLDGVPYYLKEDVDAWVEDRMSYPTTLKRMLMLGLKIVCQHRGNPRQATKRAVQESLVSIRMK